MMSPRYLLFFLLTFCFYCNAQVHENDILGRWMADDKSCEVDVSRDRGSFRARVVWFDERLGSGTPMATRMDSHNPEPARRTAKIIGMDILSGLVYNPEKKIWENGKIYDASSGRTWDSYCTLEKPNLLKVRGYWKYTWIGKSMYFRKVKQ